MTNGEEADKGDTPEDSVAQREDDTPQDSVEESALPSEDSPALGSAIGSQFNEHTDPPAPVVSGATPPPPGGASASPDQVAFGSAAQTPTFSQSTPTAEYPAAPPSFGDSSGGGSSKLPWIAAVVGVIVLLGGGAFFALSAFGASGGAASPEDGIDAVLAAVGDEDFVTLAELMEPSERRTLAEPLITEVLPELIRLGVLDDTADASNVEGVDVTFTDVEYRVDRLVGVDDIAHVFLTNGELSTSIDGGSLPFTDEVDTADVDSDDTQVLTDDGSPIVFVERDGNWFFSLWFTIAESARLDAGERLPTEDESPAIIPNDTPAEAVEGMFDALTDFDLRSVIGHMDPEEMAVVYRYSPLFLADAQAALDEMQGDLRDEGIEWEMSNFDFDVEESGDDAVVTMRGFSLDVAADGLDLSLTYSRDQLTGELAVEGVAANLTASTTEFALDGDVDGSPFDAAITVDPEDAELSGTITIDGDEFEGSLVLDPAGECSTFTITGSDGTDETGCLEEEADIAGVGTAVEALEDWSTEFPGLPMRTRRTDDGWYVSPIGSVLDSVVTSLEGLEEGDFDNVFGDTVGGSTGILFGDDDPFGILDGVGGGSESDDGPTEDVDGGIIGTFADPLLEDEVVADVPDDRTETFDGEIGENGFDIYFIDLDAGSEITITAEAGAGGLDTTLRLVSPLGEQIAFNDDAPPTAGLPGDFDSQIAIVAPEPGTYTIEVAGFDAESVGEYQLEINRELPVSTGVETPEAPIGAPDIEDSSLLVTELGETQRFEQTLVVASAADEYQIFLEAGETLTVSVEAAPGSGLDPVIVFLDSAEEVIAANDDAPDGSPVANTRDSFLPVNITVAGEYFLRVGSFDGQSSGDYVMVVQRETTPLPPAIPLAVASGDVITEAGTVEVPVIYSIDLEAGDTVLIAVDADFGQTLDPIVSLLFNETEVGRNDDAGAETLNSELTVSAAATGTHTIIVEGFGGSRGTYQLTVQRN